MSANYNQVEQKRFLYLAIVVVLGGALTSYWLLSLCVVLIIYIAWMHYKLYQLSQWLSSRDPALIPDSDGLWEHITLQIHQLQKYADKRKQRMKKLLKRLQGIITGLPYATIVLNNKNEIDWANKHSQELLGVNIKKDRGQRIENLIRLPKIYKTLQKNTTAEFEINAPRNGQKKLALQIISVHEDLKLLIARDISERVNIQQMRKNFIANASHELRTPLTVISGYLEMLQTSPELSKQLKGFVDTASQQSSRMRSIIEDLLTLSRLENSELDGATNLELDMPDIIQSICDNETSLSPDHLLKTNIDQSLTIKGAESEIISVCTNLIHNAIRHTLKGTKIEVSWHKTSNNEACLTVKDNGDGIPAEHLSHLTERFYRVDKGRSQQTGGTGLGLAIVQHIISRHQGQLEIESEVGKGSLFVACFPCY